MARTITQDMKRMRKSEHNRRRSTLTNLQRAITEQNVGTHRRQDGAVAHRPGRSRLGADWTHIVHLCPGRCGAPVARDMERCRKHQKASR